MIATTDHDHIISEMINLEANIWNQRSKELINISQSDASIISLDFSRAAFLIALCLICILAIVGNGLVLYAIATSNNLKTVTNYIVASLAGADFIVAAVVIPFQFYHELTEIRDEDAGQSSSGIENNSVGSLQAGGGYVEINRLERHNLSSGFEIIDYNSTVLGLRGGWKLGLVVCDLWHATDVLASTASIWSLCIISLDRYLALRDPFTYPVVLSVGRVSGAITGVWSASALLAFPAIAWWRAVSPHQYVNPQICDFPDSFSYLAVSSLISFYIPLAIVACAYWNVYRAATRYERGLRLGNKSSTGVKGQPSIMIRIHRGRASKKMKLKKMQNIKSQEYRNASNNDRRNTPSSAKLAPDSLNSMEDIITDFPSPDVLLKRVSFSKSSESCAKNLNTPSKSVDLTMSLIYQPHKWRHVQKTSEQNNTHRMPGLTEKVKRQLNRFTREKKAAKTLAIVVGCFVGCWAPFFIVNIWLGICKLDSFSGCVGCRNFLNISVDLFSIVSSIGYCSCALNPAIYAWRMREFRAAFRRILCSRRYRMKTATAYGPLSLPLSGNVSTPHLQIPSSNKNQVQHVDLDQYHPLSQEDVLQDPAPHHQYWPTVPAQSRSGGRPRNIEPLIRRLYSDDDINDVVAICEANKELSTSD